MAANERWQKATNCDKFIAAFCRNLTLVRLRLASLAEWRRGWCLPKIARRYGQDKREIFALMGCWRMFRYCHRGRARESEARWCVAGRRVNLLLASPGCAPNCTRRPAPGICFYDSAPGELLYDDDCELHLA
jgi:hypothetical protein